MPPDPRAAALRNATANPGGGTNLVMPQRSGGDPRTVPLRTFEPGGPPRTPGPALQRPDNSELFAGLNRDIPSAEPPSGGGAVGGPAAGLSGPAFNEAMAPPPPPVAPTPEPSTEFKNPDYYEPTGDNFSGEPEYIQPVVNPTPTPDYSGIGSTFGSTQPIEPDTEYYKNPDWYQPFGDNFSGEKQYLTQAEMDAKLNPVYDEWNDPSGFLFSGH